ncbi:phosphatase PAP2 family protein [Fibrella sp. HMF5335]|uniref:Phosphatase PAP2 family protein n=1 Tax=Fibrella rubiginis TaxID=2817060 RepID=A0A939G9N7_9BACT|nr:phosphatase PAP2 family protein [Fibrella rubiginis]MBO0935022.1 phosphatase PAP2 family protein [Fibrella rubiginis]
MTTNELNTLFQRRFNRLANRYPTAAYWLARRLSTDSFTGLPLTGLLGLLLGTGMLLSEVAENIANAEPMVQIDGQFTHWLFQGRSSRLSQLLFGITWFGSRFATVGFTLIGSIVLLWQRQRRNALILWLLLGGVSLFVQVGKRTFIRARPQQVAYYPEVGYSFPSGHSAVSMTLYGLLAYWAIRRLRSATARLLTGLIAVCLILAVGFSRIYLGVHFLSDVLGGYLLGIGWLSVGIILSEWQRKARPQNSDQAI